MVKSVHFCHVHSQFFDPVNAGVYTKVVSLPYQAKIIFEELISFFNIVQFPADAFHEIT